MPDNISNEIGKLRPELHAENNCDNENDKFHGAKNDFLLEILDQTPALIWRADKNAKCDWFNNSWLKFTGRSMEQEYGNGWTEGVHSDDLPRCIDIYLSAFKKHEAFEMEYRLRRYDGEYRWILDLGKPYKGIEGKFAGYIGYCFDITERKNIDFEQKASIERLESLVKISHFTNHSMQELLDYSLNEAVKLTGSKIGYIYFYDEESKNFILNSWSKHVMKECEVMNPHTCYELDKTGLWGEAVRQRRPIIINDYHAENPHKKGYPLGHVKLSRFLTLPIIDHEKIVCVVGVANKETDYIQADVLQLTLLLQSSWQMTERIRAEAELIKAKIAAEAANKAKSDFLASMSHEIRTPMNGILGIVSLMMENEENDQKQESLRIIRSSATSLMNLISNILDVSKIEAGQMNLTFSDFSLKNEIEDVIKLLSSSAAIKGLHIQSQYSTDLPEYFSSDANRIRQILLNLLGNAVKFTDHGSIFIDVDCVTCSKKEAVLRISIEDTGIGIPQEKMPILFKKFSRITPVNSKIEGTGLGLAITKDLVEKLGGNCRVESIPGVGSVFRVELPLALAKTHIEPKIAPEPESELKTHLWLQRRSHESANILVVDDVEINIKVICLMLERLGLKTEIARNGQEAVEMAAKKFYDLILMDCFMPAMDGYEATRKIREQEKKTSRRSIIVAITANAVEQGRKKCMESGMDDCIFKPVEFAVMRKFIEKLFVTVERT